MKRLVLLLTLLALGSGRAQPPKTLPPAASPAPAARVFATAGSAQNWSLHTFTDADGFREMSVRGTEVHPAGPDKIAVTDLSITVYSGDASAHVDTMFLSPAALFFSKENRASGEKTVRMIRDDLEATGTRWTYDQKQKRVLLDGNVRIVFKAEIKDLLK